MSKKTIIEKELELIGKSVTAYMELNRKLNEDFRAGTIARINKRGWVFSAIGKNVSKGVCMFHKCFIGLGELERWFNNYNDQVNKYKEKIKYIEYQN
jgi:hypothetical protein